MNKPQIARTIRKYKAWIYWTLHHIKHRKYATEHSCLICKFQGWNYIRKVDFFGVCEDCGYQSTILRCNEANDGDIINHCDKRICEACFYIHVGVVPR